MYDSGRVYIYIYIYIWLLIRTAETEFFLFASLWNPDRSKVCQNTANRTGLPLNRTGVGWATPCQEAAAQDP